jgi:NADPH:quinone reductase-like Zn-dependent oxidoreductase
VKAWVAPRYGPPEVLELQELPDPQPGRGEAVVQVRAIGLNFADCAARMGVYPRVPRPPFVPGMEVAGDVVAVGEEVEPSLVGARVAAVPIFAGHAEAVRVPVSHLRPLPAGVDYVTAAALAVTGITADHGLRTVGRLRPGERVVITAAAGGVGTMAVQMAAAAGAQVVAVASTPAKRELAARLGARATYGYEEYATAVQGGVDVIFDSVGGRLFRTGWRALRGDGRYILFGFAAAVGPRRVRWLRSVWELASMGVVIPALLVSPCRTLAGFNLSLVPHLAAEMHERFDRLLAAIQSGTLQPVVGTTVPFAELPRAHALLQGRGSVGKVVVTVP